MESATVLDRSFSFSVQLIKLVSALPYREEISIIRRQVLRSGTSVGANVTEAQNAATKREFLRYINIALCSARETEYWLHLLKEIIPPYRDRISPLVADCHSLSKILAAILITGKKNLR